VPDLAAADPRKRLKNLLEYTSAVVSARDAPVFDLAAYPLRLLDSDLLGRGGEWLPGIAPDATGDAWLTFARLKEVPHPAVPQSIADWVRIPARATPTSTPTLITERTVLLKPEDAEALVKQGHVQPDDVHPVAVDDAAALPEPPRVTVLLRLDRHPEVNEAFQAWRDSTWQAWAVSEQPRREAIRIYNQLFEAQARVGASGAEGGLELVVGVGIARWARDGRRFNIPLIEQRAEFDLALNGTLAVVPRQVPPVPVLRPFQECGIPDATRLQREMAQQLEDIFRDPDRGFSPWNRDTFEPQLRTCAARLDATGTVVEPPDLGAPGASLQVSLGFCLFVRPRREDILVADIRRLIQHVDSTEGDLPEVARRLVMPPPDTAAMIDWDDLDQGTAPTHGGRPTAGAGESVRPTKAEMKLFLPLPANAEQIEIARRLDHDNVPGIVVQGPPGTGKTHTIANIIGHAMASGKRVLVAAHTAEALGAIREKLPEPLRGLTIAVTHSDREGARQLEDAVQALADKAHAIDPKVTKQQIQDRTTEITNDDERTAEIQAALGDIARANLTDVQWRGGAARPAVIAKWVAENSDAHGWFPDRLDLIPAHAPPLDAAVIDRARALRKTLADDLRYDTASLPDPTTLPALAEVIAAHSALSAKATRDIQDPDLPRPDLSVAHPGEVAELAEWLDRLANWRDACSAEPWLPLQWRHLVGKAVPNRPETQGATELLGELAALYDLGSVLHRHAIELDEHDDPARLDAALANLAAGKAAFGFFAGFGRSPLKQLLETVRIAGTAPDSADAWKKVHSLHSWRRSVLRFQAKWNALAVPHGLPALPSDTTGLRATVLFRGRLCAEALALAAEAPARRDRIAALFAYGIQADLVVVALQPEPAIAALRASQADDRVPEATRLQMRLRSLAAACGHDLGESLLQVADALADPSVRQAELGRQWQAVQDEAKRLWAQRASHLALDDISKAVAACGAPNWATAIRQPVAGEAVNPLPATWHDAWEWSRARGFIARVADRAVEAQLAEEQAEIVKRRERRFQEIIELHTYLGLKRALSESVMAELSKFLAAVAKLGKGTGKTANRQRRIMRDSTMKVAQAVPCWIMPEWRVAEQLPPELGAFDLVIIDEASQSNLLALPVILRGKKVLIVGDDKQVSPVSVGLDDAAITRLRATFLHGQPLAEQLDPATSLYELGGMMYPGTVIALKEHFRCVEPIIAFSQRFYRNGLLPLRLPKPSERLDPPLVDILVEGGRRRGDLNRDEAEVIVDEIKGIVADSAMHAHGPRSIGVISLHANKQAKLINDRLIDEIGPEVMTRHHLMCGDAATFQGQERDIMFLSMVHDQATANKQAARLYEQRYNVALSRARDRMVLVRSVTESMLKDGDIKHAVLRHFQDPLPHGPRAGADDLLAICESGFERDVGRRLLDAGYRVRPQVPVGPYRIDFVVEGEADRRLAIELDGDGFHGPDRWAQDIQRQKALERLGWVFWRCWASCWEADKDGTFRALTLTLEQRGIAPLGGSTAAPPPVEFRRVAAPSATRAPRPAEAGAPDAVEAGTRTSSDVTTQGPAQAAAATPLLAPFAAHDAREPEQRRVCVGDTVVVRYVDGQSRSQEVTIGGQAPRSIAPGSPLAMAILGKGIEEEASFDVDGRTRTVMVESFRSDGSLAA
jgi:very-short-patch-repair endonuclease